MRRSLTLMQWFCLIIPISVFALFGLTDNIEPPQVAFTCDPLLTSNERVLPGLMRFGASLFTALIAILGVLGWSLYQMSKRFSALSALLGLLLIGGIGAMVVRPALKFMLIKNGRYPPWETLGDQLFYQALDKNIEVYDQFIPTWKFVSGAIHLIGPLAAMAGTAIAVLALFLMPSRKNGEKNVEQLAEEARDDLNLANLILYASSALLITLLLFQAVWIYWPAYCLDGYQASLYTPIAESYLILSAAFYSATLFLIYVIPTMALQARVSRAKKLFWASYESADASDYKAWILRHGLSENAPRAVTSLATALSPLILGLLTQFMMRGG